MFRIREEILKKQQEQRQMRGTSSSQSNQISTEGEQLTNNGMMNILVFKVLFDEHLYYYLLLSDPMGMSLQGSAASHQYISSKVELELLKDTDRCVIWEGDLLWKEMTEMTEYSIRCSVTSEKDADGIQKVSSDNWPKKLIMQFFPKALLSTIGGSFFKDSKSVLFHPEKSGTLEKLARNMEHGFAGCVHFVGIKNCLIKVIKGQFTYMHNYLISSLLACENA